MRASCCSFSRTRCLRSCFCKMRLDSHRMNLLDLSSIPPDARILHRAFEAVDSKLVQPTVFLHRVWSVSAARTGNGLLRYASLMGEMMVLALRHLAETAAKENNHCHLRRRGHPAVTVGRLVLSMNDSDAGNSNEPGGAIRN